MPVITNSMQWEELAVPLIKGLDVNSQARLVDPATLVVADNVVFPRDGGPEKRGGYVGELVQDFSVVSNLTPVDGLDYEYGHGYTTPPSGGGAAAAVTNVSGPLRFTALRDSEELVCSGSTLWSKVNNKWRKVTDSFYINNATTVNIGKTQNSQNYADLADNGQIKVLVFRDTAAGTVVCKVYDSVTGSVKFSETLSVSDPEYTLAMPVGEYIHVYVNDTTDNKLYLHVVNPSDSAFTQYDLGDCYFNYDVAKVNESLVLVAKRTVTNTVAGGYINAVGTTNSTIVAFNTAMALDGNTVLGFTVAVHPIDGTICVALDNNTTQVGVIQTRQFVFIDSSTVTSYATCKRVAVVADVLYENTFWVWTEDSTPAALKVTLTRQTATAATLVAHEYNVHISGKPFNIGAVPFIWLCRPSAYQTSFLLYGKDMLPCGRLEYGTSESNVADAWFFSSNQIASEPYKVHGCIMYNQSIVDQPGVFHELSVKEYRLDFDAVPSVSQAGRCTYFSGSQVWVYDGETVCEAGFHFAPEGMTITPDAIGGGSLTNAAEYFYLVYLCHKNAQGEEVRGPAIFAPKLTMGASDDTATISGTTLPTRREGTYFLVFRNANTGTNWHLVSDRDPASTNCPKNTGATWSFVDLLSDDDIITREIDAATGSNYLTSFSPPSCTVLAFGKDRLWVAGGEISPGVVWPSRLFTANEAVSFHPALAHTIDRTTEPVTAFGFQSNYTVVFKRNSAYIIEGDGLDNNVTGSIYASYRVLTDVGSVSRYVAPLTAGLFFQSESGYRLLEPGGHQAVDIGRPINELSSTCTGMYVDTTNTHVIAYQDTKSLVFNYSNGLWSAWSINPVAGLRSICVGNYYLTPGSVFTDNGSYYVYRVKTSAMSASLGGFQRVRKIGADGHLNGSASFKVRTYLDDKPYASDVWVISKPENTSTWGSGTWGSGLWGDATGTEQFARDDRLRWVRRPSVQKCSCIAVEIEYNGPDKGPVHTFITVTVGKKAGLDRGAK